MTDPNVVRSMIHQVGLATLVTSTEKGLIATPLPLLFDETEGDNGTFYGHLAKANSQWRSAPLGEALAILNGPDAYITPSWYATKNQTGRVVPTWMYLAVHVYGQIEFFEDATRVLDVVTRLTSLHEREQSTPWDLADAPPDYIRSQLKGIVGLRFTITRIEAKRKLDQGASRDDRLGVAHGLAERHRPGDLALAPLIPTN